ncbi:MAG TPA: hypothetical protein VMD30_14250, partial [Tepidisphaeraceae bacterium]|nr:hypothetical protein [Tepidisphaeraceae bacterium]
TTRDALKAEIPLLRGMAHLIDVAGLEEDAADSASIAGQMHHRTLREIETADVVLLIRDCTDSRPPLALSRPADLTVFTKSDLLSNPPAHPPHVSAQTGENLDRLRQLLDSAAFGADSAGSSLTLNARHHAAIEETTATLHRCIAASPPELIAADLRSALDSLGTILGQVTPDDVLGKIFSTFCIGK